MGRGFLFIYIILFCLTFNLNCVYGNVRHEGLIRGLLCMTYCTLYKNTSSTAIYKNTTQMNTKNRIEINEGWSRSCKSEVISSIFPKLSLLKYLVYRDIFPCTPCLKLSKTQMIPPGLEFLSPYLMYGLKVS